jgi:adenylate cyclase
MDNLRLQEIAQRHVVQKIKTIGDTIMAVANLLRPVENPVLRLARCGLEMIEAVRKMDCGWDVRIGINVGPVVAGVLGRRRHLFDLWGDTVDTASRMESYGVPGRITLSLDAWRQIEIYGRGTFETINVRGKSYMDVVRLRELRP